MKKGCNIPPYDAPRTATVFVLLLDPSSDSGEFDVEEFGSIDGEANK